MDTSKPNSMKRTRREFLAAAKGVGLLGAIALIVGKGAAPDNATAVATTADAPPDSGYRETEHIRKYYHSVRY